MVYSFDNYDRALVIQGWEAGIADDPYEGIADARNVNIISVPGEASVNFATSQTTQASIANGSITSANAGTHYLTYTGAANLENNMAINFTAQSGLGVTANLQTTYWVFNVGGAGAGTFQISSTYNLGSPSAVGVTNGTGTFTVYRVSRLAPFNPGSFGNPVDFAYDAQDGKYFMLDGVGQVWSNWWVTGTNNYWTYVGSTGDPSPKNNGAGIVFYQSSNTDRYLFVFRLQSIDYLTITTSSVTYPQWTYGWNPVNGTTQNSSGYLNTSTLFHQAKVGPDNSVYYCDGAFIPQWFQTHSQGYTEITYSGLSGGTLSVGDIVSDAGGTQLYTNIVYTALTGTLAVGDIIQGSNGITGIVISFTGASILTYTPNGAFSTSGALTDNTSGATATISSTYVLGNSGTIISFPTNSTILIVTPPGGFASSGTLTDITSLATATISSTSKFGFVPTITGTYSFINVPLLPFNDAAQCFDFIGANMIIGGQKNVMYSWDLTYTVLGTSPEISYEAVTQPIFLPESNCINMIGVGGNAYAFTGNRGRIYITNGTQAQLFKKIPDHISETIEPYYTWGGAISQKNQLYFGFSVTTNSGTANNNYGGIWAIDLDTKAIRLTNQLSYGTYAGIASAIIANFGTDPAGTGLFIGWYDGSVNYGIDTTISTPYTGSQASLDSDLIPIGTFDMPRDFTRIEYKLTKPMVSGESVTIKYRLDFSQNYTTVLTDNTVGNYALSGPINFKNAQWVQFQVVLNSTATNPSYTRLKNIRITGLVGPSLGSQEQLSI